MHITEALRDDFDTVKPLLTESEGRRELTRYDPLLFALVYFPHHLKDAEGNMTLCDFHIDMLEWAKSWTKPATIRKANRAAFIAPRQSGKSTWVFLLLPMWAAAHKHKQFVAAFSDSEMQALTHLYTFKQEFDTNTLLREDFTELCEPYKTSNNARAMMDNRSQTKRNNGFVFMAKGADSAALGMKVGATRPDVILFDDIEPGESNYSEYEARKRKETLQSDLFELNAWATVGIVGTTTMPNSLIDQIRKTELARVEFDGEDEYFRESLDPDYRWVIDENIKVHYWPVILNEGTENEMSLWPERWPMNEINNERHTRSFMKNMMNRPVSSEGGYWDEDDIDIDDVLEGVGYKRTIISLDPAVTTKKASDYTGIAVVSQGADGHVYVRYAEQVKLDSDTLALKVTELIERFKADICVVETNQGGDLWKQVFRNIPCRFVSIRQKEKKEVRASQAVDHYKRGQVSHTRHFPIAEEQMLAFPHVTHDDVVDAIVTGVLTFKKYARNGVSVSTRKYTEV